MKKFIIITMLAVSAIAFGTLTSPKDPGNYSPASTVQRRAAVVATVTADATALDVNTSSWADCKTLFIPIPPEWNIVNLSFYGWGDGTGGGDPNNATFSYDVHLCDVYGGTITISTANSGVVGAQQLSHNPDTGDELYSGAVDPNYCWADTITEGTVKGDWGLAYFDYEGSNGKAEMSFDRRSAYGIYVRIYNMTSSAVTSVTCVMNGY